MEDNNLQQQQQNTSTSNNGGSGTTPPIPSGTINGHGLGGMSYNNQEQQYYWSDGTPVSDEELTQILNLSGGSDYLNWVSSEETASGGGNIDLSGDDPIGKPAEPVQPDPNTDTLIWFSTDYGVKIYKDSAGGYYWVNKNGDPSYTYPYTNNYGVRVYLPVERIFKAIIQGQAMGIFTPDGQANPDVNLNNLMEYFNQLMLGNEGYGQGVLSSSFFSSRLMEAYQNLLFMSGFLGLSGSTCMALAEKIFDYQQTYIHESFQQAINYQTWYLQQEYNSPVNQIQRLREAGLSSAFVMGNYSNTAQSSASSQVAAAAPSQRSSGAGEIMQQEEAQSKSLFGQIFGSAVNAVGSFVSCGATALVSIAQATAIRKMLPVDIAKAGTEVVNNTATYTKLRSENDLMQQSIAFNSLDRAFGQSQTILDQADKNVQTARSAYLDAFNNYSSEVEEQVYNVNVTTKSGSKETRQLTSDEVKDVLEKRGTLSDGSVVEGVSSWDQLTEADIRLKAGVSLPFKGGDMGVQGGLHHADRSTSSQRDLTNHSQVIEDTAGNQTSSRKDGYSSDGSSFSIGDTTFISTIRRKRVPLPEHKAYIESKLKAYQDSIDNWNSLSEGARARLCLLHDNLTRNLSSYSAGEVSAYYKALLDSVPASKKEISDVLHEYTPD